MKKLGKVNICGVEYEVNEYGPDEREKLEDCWAYCNLATQEIAIHKGIAATKFRQVLLHEGAHGLLEESGIKDFIADSFGVKRNSEQMEKFEETFIRLLIPHLTVFLSSLKGLKA